MTDDELDEAIDLMVNMHVRDLKRIRARLKTVAGALNAVGLKENKYFTSFEVQTLVDLAEVGLSVLHHAQRSGKLGDWVTVYKMMRRQRAE